MGATIKRQPINFDIPDSPDYKYLNVTDFGGLNQTDNPFIAPSNSASECLNVYVDNEHALTTRPRLKLKLNLSSYGVKNVYNISTGFLLQTKTGIKIYDNNTETIISIKENKSPSKTTLWRVFESNNKIYILDGSRYYVIENQICSWVEGYIPTTKVGLNRKILNSNGDENVDLYGSTFESFNLLTDKYKHTYYWDGTTNPEDIDGEIDNKYRRQMYAETVNVDNEFFKYVPNHAIDEDNNNFWMLGRCNDVDFTDGNDEVVFFKTTTLYEGSHDFQIERISQPSTKPEHIDGGLFSDCSYDGNVIAFSYWARSYDSSSSSKYGGLYVKRGDKFYVIKEGVGTSKEVFYSPKASSGYKQVRVSSDGSVIASYIPKFELSTITDEDGNNEVLVTWKAKILVAYYDSDNDVYKLSEQEIDDPNVKGIDLNDEASTQTTATILAFYGEPTRNNVGYCKNIKLFKYSNFTATSPTIQTDSFTPSANKDCCSWALSVDGASLLVELYDNITRSENLRLFTNINSGKFDAYDELLKPKGTGDMLYTFSKNNDKIYFWLNGRGGNEYPNGSQGWIVLNNYTYVYDNFQDPRNLEEIYGGYNRWRARSYENYGDVNTVVIFQAFGTGGYKSWCKTFYDFNNNEPLLIYTKTLNNLDKYTIEGEETTYEKWKLLNSTVIKSDLITRFENNTWFAKDNYVFHTAYNDASYVPISSYNDVGNKNITGFNVLDDSTLAIYTENNIFIARNTIIDNSSTYIYSETINLNGNIAKNGCCVTPLTVTPLHIGVDGIYTLKQLTNVQSGERITHKINDTIEKLWKDLSLQDKYNMMSLVFSDWVMLYIPGSITKCFVLDDRTQSWFYWEFKTNIINAFTIENVVYLVDDVGKIYVFTTQDSINENNNQNEYYDDLDEKTLINWYWTSQILPLGTINYSKKLNSTTFILTDNEEMDDYALNYKFKTFRKFTTETPQITISNDLNYIQSTTKRTLIPRFNFIQIQISNETTNDIINDINHNKFRLVGLGLKYELLERLL